MIRSVSGWVRILMACGVSQLTADRWGEVFAATIRDDTFSSGIEEMDSFLATILHESNMLTQLVEDGRYSAKRIRELGMASKPGSRWRSLVDRADELAYNPEAFFEAIYGGRMGNDQPGDGARYPGRGLIMLTGKDNYRWAGDRAGQDLVGIPTLAEQPHFALEFAIDWWEGKVPDSVMDDERQIRRIVNGGSFGLAHVEDLAARVRTALA